MQRGLHLSFFFFFSLVTLTGINGWSGLGEILFYYGRAGSWLAYGLFVLLRRGRGVGSWIVFCVLFVNLIFDCLVLFNPLLGVWVIWFI